MLYLGWRGIEGCRGGRGEVVLRQQAGEQAVHALFGVAYRHAAGGVAMVRLHQREHLALAGVAAQHLVLQRHLHGHLHAHRTAVGEEHVVQPRRGNAHQLLCELVGGIVGQAAQHHMAKLPRLLADGGDEARMAVAVNHAPPGAGGIQQALAAFQRKVAAAAADHFGRRRLGFEMGIGVPNGGVHGVASWVARGSSASRER